MNLKYPFFTPASHILFCVYLACYLDYNKGFQELLSRLLGALICFHVVSIDRCRWIVLVGGVTD